MTRDRAGTDRRPWFQEWFGSEYLALYPHRDGAEARRAVALLREATGRKPGSRVLDLACGAGRHLIELQRAGYRAAGLDLSLLMLEAARRRAGAAPLVRGDMRSLPFRAEAFDVVVSFFTSFGYFEDEAGDLRVLAEVRRILARGGAFLLDFMNARAVAENLRREDRRTVSGVAVVQERRLVEDGRIVEKRIRIGARGETPERTFLERVRMYSPAELASMMRQVGLASGPVFGGYDLSPFDLGSPRCIVLAEAR